MDRKKLTLIAMASGAAAALATFLTWVHLSHPVLSKSVSGIESTDGVVILILGAIGAACAWLVFSGRSTTKASRVLLIGSICFALAATIATIDFLGADRHSDATARLGIEITRAFGFFLVVAATLAGTAASIWAWRKQPAA